MTNREFLNNTDKSRYEYRTEGGVTFANYRRRDGTLYIDHVEAPVALRGKGTAGKLMEYVLASAREDNLEIVPICSYAAAWLRRHDAGNVQ